jgi:hypothetical protein
MRRVLKAAGILLLVMILSIPVAWLVGVWAGTAIDALDTGIRFATADRVCIVKYSHPTPAYALWTCFK